MAYIMYDSSKKKFVLYIHTSCVYHRIVSLLPMWDKDIAENNKQVGHKLPNSEGNITLWIYEYWGIFFSFVDSSNKIFSLNSIYAHATPW